MPVVHECCSREKTAKFYLANISQQQLETLRNFIYKRVYSLEDAEDILQQTFLEALRSESSFLHQSQASTWIFGIAINLVRNYFRKVYRQPSLVEFDEELDSAGSGQEISDACHTACDLERTIEAIAMLPATMRETLEVAVATEGSYQQAAEALGVPIGTVRSRLSRARTQLRGHLKDRFSS